MSCKKCCGAVIVNGEPLAMTKGETELEMVPYVEGGELVLLWQKHREGLGNTVELTTGVHLLFFTASCSPAVAYLMEISATSLSCTHCGSEKQNLERKPIKSVICIK